MPKARDDSPSMSASRRSPSTCGPRTPWPLASDDAVIAASLAGARLNARSTFRHETHGLTVTIEYPIKLINLHAGGGRYQVCTGAVALPDLTTWDGAGVDRVFVAHAAFTADDHVEFILRRSIDVAESELAWAAAVRGRDRYQRRDSGEPADRPPPRAAGYFETWELPAVNTIWRASSESRP